MAAAMNSFLRRLPLCLALAGCAPTLKAPDTAISVHAYLPGQKPVAATVPDKWWRIFRSPQLDALEQAGLRANPTIGEAAQNLAAAEQNAIAANGGFLPQIGFGQAGGSLAARQSYPAGPNQSPAYTIYSPEGVISYDPGLFGAARSTQLNGAALAAYQAAELEAARQSVAGNIAAAAITLAGLREQIATTQAILAAEQKLLTLLHGEYADGAIPMLPVLQQQSVIQATQASLPPLRAQADAQRDRLAILTGTLPADFFAPDIPLKSLALPARPPAALPAAYLKDRPDLRAALAQVSAQNAALGLAVAHLYPDISLTAAGGYASETLNTLIEPGSGFWSLATNILAPIYDGGMLRAKKRAAEAQLHAAVFAYRAAVLTAFGQAAEALQAVQTGQNALASAEAAAQTANAAYQLAEAQFRLGAIDLTTVLTAQATAAQQALAMAQARTNLALAIANLQAVMAR
ncbi:MAG: hypothetical protein B7Z80_17555 [Rhodospirillales bacterium 20-64-7]|nr:MAG: hypothetical protein B7Z80_17555 [Rhodospirillales bacterium 20-64-7]